MATELLEIIDGKEIQRDLFFVNFERAIIYGQRLANSSGHEFKAVDKMGLNEPVLIKPKGERFSNGL